MTKPQSRKKPRKRNPKGLFCVEVVPYHEYLWWSFAPTFEEYRVQFNHTLGHHNLDVSPSPASTAGQTEIYQENGVWYPVIWVSKPNEPWVLAHELEHFVHWLLDSKGLKYCDASEEAYAYLIGHLMEIMLLNSRLDLPLKVGVSI